MPSRGAPGSPAVDLEFVGIAADPVDILEGFDVGAAPAGGLGECIPIRGREQGGCDVHLLQLGAAAEVRVDFVGEIIVRIGGEIMSKLRVDQAMQHKGIDGEERSLEDDVFVSLRVAIGDPALARGADAGEVVVVAIAPD